MSFNPLQERGIPLDKQLRNWSGARGGLIRAVWLREIVTGVGLLARDYSLPKRRAEIIP